MDASQLAFVTSRPYSTLLKDAFIHNKLFQYKQLNFNMQAQTETNWCWAATATSVSHFYWLWSTWSQCKVANGELGLNNCCNSSVPSACNVPWYLDRALTRTNNFVSIMTGQASFEAVRAEIDAGRPVGARIGWSGGGGHFMVIYGYSWIAGAEYFDIDDPIYGKSHLSVSDFASNYQGSGTWTHTYFTKSYFRLPIKFLYPEEPILRKIWEVRPLLRLKREATVADDRQRQPEAEEGSLGIAQRIYAVGLDSILSDDRPEPKPVGLRVYELVDNTPRAFFDVSEGEDGRVLQMSSSRNHLEPFARALGAALSAVERRGGGGGELGGEGGGEEAEMRLFRAPALNFEALWLAYDGRQGDLLVPLLPLGGLSVGEPVPYERALEAMREAARRLAGMDDTMGA